MTPGEYGAWTESAATGPREGEGGRSSGRQNAPAAGGRRQREQRTDPPRAAHVNPLILMAGAPALAIAG